VSALSGNAPTRTGASGARSAGATPSVQASEVNTKARTKLAIRMWKRET
jgi:hypothetical protein